MTDRRSHSDEYSRYSRSNYGRSSRGERSRDELSRQDRPRQERPRGDRPRSERSRDERSSDRRPASSLSSRTSSQGSSSRNAYSRSDSNKYRASQRANEPTARERLQARRAGSAASSSSASGVEKVPVKAHRRGERLSAEELHGQYSRRSARYSSKEVRKANRGKKIAIGIACSLLAVLVVGGVAFASFVKKIDNELSGNKSDEEIAAINAVLSDRPNNSDPFYMLLLGSDARADSEEMGARADTSIVARVDPKKNTVTLISIPRDTLIYIDGDGPYKFNAAYSFRGTAGAIEAASELLDVEISHYAEVGFESLVDLVDAVGGVEVDVPARINDPNAGDIVIEKGLQTLDGEAALVFARSRAYADGDFTRTSNQRLLIEALASKVLTMPIDQMPTVVQEAAKCVTTDMSITEIVSLALEFADDDGELTIYSTMVPSTVDMIDGISYVITDETGLKKMMEVVEQGGDPNSVDTYGATGSSLGR